MSSEHSSSESRPGRDLSSGPLGNAVMAHSFQLADYLGGAKGGGKGGKSAGTLQQSILAWTMQAVSLLTISFVEKIKSSMMKLNVNMCNKFR